MNDIANAMSAETLLTVVFLFGLFVGLFAAAFVAWTFSHIKNEILESRIEILQSKLRMADMKGGAV